MFPFLYIYPVSERDDIECIWLWCRRLCLT